MSGESLLVLVEKLKVEIAGLESGNDRVIERVNSLLDVIAQSPGAGEEEAGSEHIEDIVTDTITEFEASHPKLTAVLNEILVTLSSIGV